MLCLLSFVRLVGDVLVATGFLSYAGPFNQEYRDALLSSWQKEMKIRNIPNSKDLNVTSILVDSATVCSLHYFYFRSCHELIIHFFYIGQCVESSRLTE